MLIWIKKLWSLTVNWQQLTFSPIQLTFRSTDQLIEQKCDPRLETWHEQSWRSMMNHESHLRHKKSNCPWENQNPNLWTQCFRRWACLVKLLRTLEHLRSLVRNVLRKREGKFWGTTHVHSQTHLLTCVSSNFPHESFVGLTGNMSWIMSWHQVKHCLLKKTLPQIFNHQSGMLHKIIHVFWSIIT